MQFVNQASSSRQRCNVIEAVVVNVHSHTSILFLDE